MTRTKNRVFFVAPEQNPSEFLLELKRDYKNVVLHGNWNEDKPQNIAKKACPICGYPMQLKYKQAYGLRLYICTNEPEICGFMTNDYRGGKMCIQKCDRCMDGYLIVKTGRENGLFLGCTNYKADGTGCNKSISKKYYYDQMGYAMEPETENMAAEPVQRQRTPDRPGPKRQTPEQQKQMLPPHRQQPDDYIEISRAATAPVMYNGRDLNEVVYTILKALQNVSKVKYYGVTMLVDVLRGANNKRLIDNSLDQVSEYGLLKKIPRETLENIIDWLLKEHYMLKTKGKYPVLHSTYDGLHYKETLTEAKLEELRNYLEEVYNDLR